MAYLHDAFISYRRHAQWTPWVREKVKPLLDGYLSQELGRQADIFVDERINPGADWPHALGNSLAASRVMVTIFSRDYFGSEWCLNELDLMHDRLQTHAAGELIIPLVFHDGDLIPDEIGRLQSVNMLDCRNPHMQPNTARFERFADAIGSLAPRIVAAIEAAPPHDPAWNAACCARFDAVYAACRGRTTTVPLTTITRKPLPVPTLPPRVSP